MHALPPSHTLSSLKKSQEERNQVSIPLLSAGSFFFNWDCTNKVAMLFYFKKKSGYAFGVTVFEV
jgi:hypothetical protein